MIEVVVTLSIIALVASVAIPALFDLAAPQVDAGPLEPARALLLEARQQSERFGVEVEVVLVPASGRYRVETRRSDGSVAGREGVLPITALRPGKGDDRFRAVFRPVGLGVGDTLTAGAVRLWVDAYSGRVSVER